MPGGSLGFDPFVHQGFPAPQPFYAAPRPMYQAQPRPVARPIAQQPRLPVARPEPIATPPLREPVVASSKPLELPSPERLGIHLGQPEPTLPSPEKLGIHLN